jgi:hypothetical protein
MTVVVTKQKIQGIYKAAISNADTGESKNEKKTPYVEFTFTVLEAPDPSQVGMIIPFIKFYPGTEFGMKRFVSFFETASGMELPENESVSVDEKELIEAVVTIDMQPDTFTNKDGTQGTNTKLVAWWPEDQYDAQVALQDKPF